MTVSGVVSFDFAQAVGFCCQNPDFFCGEDKHMSIATRLICGEARKLALLASLSPESGFGHSNPHRFRNLADSPRSTHPPAKLSFTPPLPGDLFRRSRGTGPPFGRPNRWSP